MLFLKEIQLKNDIYHANIVRYLDKKGNKSIIQIEDKYDQKGLLKQILFHYIGVSSSSGKEATTIYDFQNLTVNGKSKEFKGKLVKTQEELKIFMLDYFNTGKKVQLICAKEDCNDPNCNPQINIGNKIKKIDNTKRPYFSSNCNRVNSGESIEHLNTKIDIFKYLLRKQAYYLKTNNQTKIKNIEIEKTFCYGNGQERRADVYYEKYYMKNNELIIEKFAIEVQRSDISYEELEERTNWYKKNGIATVWIVVNSMFSSDKDTIDSLSKKDFNLPLLPLIKFSMKMNNGRFYIYDNKKSKIIPLTVYQENIEKLNEENEVEQRKMKLKFSTDNLLIISNNLQNGNDKYYQTVLYRSHRDSSSVGIELTNLGIFPETNDLIHKIYDKKSASYKFMHFKTVGESSLSNQLIQQREQELNTKKFKV